MKTKFALIAALTCALCSTGSAFSLDFAGLLGTSLPPNPLVINVPGYGNVTFQAGAVSTLVVSDAYKTSGFNNPSLAFDENDGAKVTFNGTAPTNVAFTFVGVSQGEAFDVNPDLFTPQAFVVNLKGSGNGAGIYQVSFDAVPEPTAALLGSLGCALLVLRRRR